MTSDPGLEILETMFYAQIKGSTVLAHDLAYYRRCPKGHEDKNYPWIRGIVIRYLDLKRQDDNRDAVRRGIAGGTPSAAAPKKKEGKAQRYAQGEGGGDLQPPKEKSKMPCFQERDHGVCHREDCP